MRLRRKDFTEEEIKKMQQMEAAGKKRTEIARAFCCAKSAVTRRLGPVRPYRGARLRPESIS
jgi:hypothetical protein